MAAACGDEAALPEDAPPDAAPSCAELRTAGRADLAPLPSRVQVQRAGRTRTVALPRPDSAPLPRLAAPSRRPASGWRAATRRAVGLRFLLIAPAEETLSYQAARSALQRIGVPHEVLLSGTDPLTDDLLYDEEGACRFAGVLVASGGLSVEVDGGWVSSFTGDEWDRLAAYEVACQAREVVWYSYPEPGVGLREVAPFEAAADVEALLTDAGRERFPYLLPGARLPVEDVYGYRSAIEDLVSTTPLLQTSDGDVLAAIHVRPDGTEVLAMTFDSGAYSTHSQLLEFGIVQWLGRGVFLGQRRIYLAPQIDDVFLASDLYTVGGAEATYRMTEEDVARLLAWDASLEERLPSGSTFVTQLAFNGLGSEPAVYPQQAMVDALIAREGRFAWINHTFSHHNMDGMSAEDTRREIAENCERAAGWELSRFRCAVAVTPEISGLDNPHAVAGLLEAGVRTVVSDTSYTAEIAPENPGDNPSPNVGRANPIDGDLFQVPRHPTNVFYNCSLPEEEVALYNELYADYWGADLTYPQILEEETRVGLSYLLAYDLDPIMFHQANLRVFDGAAPSSLYTDWVDGVIERYTSLVDLPVLGLELDEVASAMQEREAFDRCGVTATLSADGTRLTLRSIGSCVVPVTGVDDPDAGEVEVYGGVPTTHVALSPCDERELQVSP